MLQYVGPGVSFLRRDVSQRDVFVSLWVDRTFADIQGSWYLYYTAGNSDNLDGQRSHVARGTYPADRRLPFTFFRVTDFEAHRRRKSVGHIHLCWPGHGRMGYRCLDSPVPRKELFHLVMHDGCRAESLHCHARQPYLHRPGTHIV